MCARSAKTHRASEERYAFPANRILFEDEHVIVVNKPSGLPCHATRDPRRDHLFAALARFLEARDGAAQVYLALHHRLDRDTSGALLLSKAKVANRPLSDMFRDHRVQKTYVALVDHEGWAQDPPPPWSVRNYLARDKRDKHRMTAVRSGGDPARTDFRWMASYPDGTALVEARPHTGRTHQIRIHLALSGHPIRGDRLYGGTGEGRVMLHAHRLEFPHPVAGRSITVDAPLPRPFKKRG
ncbi:RluA family pseudouridine synthase [Sulfidibacter corallicola]|uniref:RluA family pseudouridine synthase n=1 Tax=Sulfidibacter corallicola TaxID=2818388 RepID=A0A8A4TPX7_SULCO|nr:RluA family pseudouridine synthase [Sulfidibacter corallicola]QTD51603.1 RluA family pseudouridine synthase [Sulfidibacter corallicola]